MSIMSELCREAAFKFHALSQGVTWLTLGHRSTLTFDARPFEGNQPGRIVILH